MIVVTTLSMDGHRITKYLGLVSGEAILGANILRDLLAGIRDIVGGRSAAYEQRHCSAACWSRSDCGWLDGILYYGHRPHRKVTDLPDPFSGDNSRDDPNGQEFGAWDTQAEVVCPYCGEGMTIELDPASGTVQSYVEDCQVCCQPWRVRVNYGSQGAAQVWLEPE